MLGEVGRRARRGTRRACAAGSAASSGSDREQRAHVHAPLDAVGQPHNTDTSCPSRAIPGARRVRVRILRRRWRPSTKSSSSPTPSSTSCSSATLERVNRASNAARAAALQRNAFEGAPLREIVKEEVERAKLPDGFVRADHRPGRGSRCGAARASSRSSRQFQSLDAARRPRSSGAAPTASRCSPRRAGARSRCASTAAAATCGRRSRAGPRALVFRNGEFELWRPTSSASPTTTDTALRRSSAREVGLDAAAVGSTSSVCTPRPIDAVLVVQRVSAMPTPCGCAHAPDSRHDPLAVRVPVHVDRHLGVDRGRVRERAAGCRRRCRSRRPRRPVRTARSARPRPPGTAAGTTRCRARVPSKRRDEPHLVRVPVADVLAGRRTELRRRAVDGRRRRRRPGATTARVDVDGVAGAAAARSRARPRVRRRAARLRATAPSCPAGSCVRPRIERPSGTGRSSSTVSRATNAAGPGSCRSHTCANSALGAPPCIAFGSHGPRVELRRHEPFTVALEERAVLVDRVAGTPHRTRARAVHEVALR